MRLIDADELKNFIDKWLSRKCDTHGNTTPNKWLNSLKRCVDEQPTAYDVDKVANAVVEITERISNNCDEIELDWPEEERTGYDMHDDIFKIRDLVKQGCVETNDMCEWHIDDDDQWHTGCRNKIDNMDNEVNTIEDYIEHTRFNYCPFCRKKIKVVELWED